MSKFLHSCTFSNKSWPCVYTPIQGRLNSLKVVGAQLTNKTHFYCAKLNSYEHLQILWGKVPPVPPWFRHLCSHQFGESKFNWVSVKQNLAD